MIESTPPKIHVSIRNNNDANQLQQTQNRRLPGRRRNWRRMGRAILAGRNERRRLRPRPRRPEPRPRRFGKRPPCARQPAPRIARKLWRSPLCEFNRRGLRRRRLRAGERPGARGIKNGPIKEGRLRPARQNRLGILHFRPAAQPLAGGNETSGALVRRASFQPRLSFAAGGNLRRRKNRAANRRRRGVFLPRMRNAPADGAKGNRRLHRRPPDGGPVARSPMAGARRHRNSGGD